MSKKIFCLLVVVMVLGCIVILFEKPFQDRFTNTDETPFYPNLKIEEIAAIDINYFMHQTHLAKNEKGEWQVSQEQQTFPANPDQVNRVLQFLTTVTKGILITTDKTKFPALQLTEGLEIIVKNAEGKKLAGMIIGKQGPDIFSTFVRDDSEDKAYLVEAYLTGMLNVPIEEWRQTDLK